MRRALAWWMSAPVDEKTAFVLMVASGALLSTLLAILPPHH